MKGGWRGEGLRGWGPTRGHRGIGRCCSWALLWRSRCRDVLIPDMEVVLALDAHAMHYSSGTRDSEEVVPSW